MLQSFHRRVVGGFLRVGPDDLNRILRGRHDARGLRRHLDLPVLCCDRAHNHLSACKADVERLCGSDGVNRRPLEGHVTCSLCLEDECFGVRLDDGASQAVSIFQRNLIREERGTKQEHCHRQEQGLSLRVSQGMCPPLKEGFHSASVRG